MTPSDFSTRAFKTASLSLFGITWSSCFSKNSRMSLLLSSSLVSRYRGCKSLRLLEMLTSGLVVTRKRIHRGSLTKWLTITSNNSLRPLCSLSSKASNTKRRFLPGSVILLSGSLKSNAKSSSTPMLLIFMPKFLDSCSKRASLYSGNARHR